MGTRAVMTGYGKRGKPSLLLQHPALEPLEPRLLLDGGVAGEQAVELFGVSSALFAENQGQWADPAVHYAFDGNGANVLFTDAGPVFQVFSGTGILPVHDEQNGPVGQNSTGRMPVPPDTRATQFSVQFDGANTVMPVGLDQAETVFNYHLGDDESTWRDGVGTYETVAYLGLYDGIDLHTRGRRDSLKYEFHVAPGADYEQISVSYAGIEGLSIDAAGALHVQTDLGELIDDTPYIYQDIGGERVEVAGAFELIDSDTYGFTLTGDYDPSRQLVIDPDLSWSTYVGGDDDEYGNAIAVDAAGAVYVAGSTDSSSWIPDGFGTTTVWKNVFVTKLTSAGAHVWSTYMGGTKRDYGHGIAVDASGGVYVTGATESLSWVSGGYDTSFNGELYDSDIFVAKLTSSAGAHSWSTYMGGSGWDEGQAIAVDGDNGVYVTGNTKYSDWIPGGFGTSSITDNVFVAKLTSAGGLTWSTYFGGSDDNEGNGIAVDGDSAVYVTGWTNRGHWAAGGFDTSHNGDKDIFVVKLTPVGTHDWSTYMGGSGNDYGKGIAVDDSDGVYVTGYTFSSGWTLGGHDTSFNGDRDAFVAKLTSDGGVDGHLWSTYMGGDGMDYGFAIAVNASGGVYVTGDTDSVGWVSGGYDTSHNDDGYARDAFVAKLTAGGGHTWSTYMGGYDSDYARGIALDASGGVYVAGYTYSIGWTSGGYDTSFNGGWKDAFVAKIDDPAVTVEASSQLSYAPADRLVDGSGLADGMHGTHYGDMWLSEPGVSPTLRFGLDGVYLLSGMRVWNYNQVNPNTLNPCTNRGVRTADVYVSVTGFGDPTSNPAQWTLLADDLLLARATGDADYAGQAYALSAGGAAAQYVLLTDMTNWGGTHTGLSEVSFTHRGAVNLNDQIDGASATASSQLSYAPAGRLVDGSGLPDGLHHSMSYADMWLSEAGASPTVRFDLGQAYLLFDMQVWNYNQVSMTGVPLTNRGVRTVDVYVSVTGTGDPTSDPAQWTQLSDDLSLAQATGEAGYAGQLYGLSAEGTAAQFVLFTDMQNWGGTATGLSEVRFNTPGAQALGSQADNVSATASSELPHMPVEHLVDGSGLSGGLHSSSYTGMWLSEAGASPTLRFDLGQTYRLSGIHVWNYNQFSRTGVYLTNRGIRTADVYVSTSGVGDPTSDPSEWILLSNDLPLAEATGSGGYVGIPYAFPARGIAARHVLVTDMTNWGGTHTGLSEVQFDHLGPVPLGDLVEGVSAAASSQLAHTPVERLADGSGLSDGQHSTSYAHMWLSQPGASSTVQFDLGAARTLVGMHVWNYNQVSGTGVPLTNRGIQTADVYVSTSGIGTPGSNPTQWTLLADDLLFAQATGAADYAGQSHELSVGGVEARYVLLMNITNWGGTHTGLSEVQFWAKS